MKAINVGAFGRPEACKLDEVPIPKPAAGEAIVKVAFADARQAVAENLMMLKCGQIRGGNPERV